MAYQFIDVERGRLRAVAKEVLLRALGLMNVNSYASIPDVKDMDTAQMLLMSRAVTVLLEGNCGIIAEDLNLNIIDVTDIGRELKRFFKSSLGSAARAS